MPPVVHRVGHPGYQVQAAGGRASPPVERTSARTTGTAERGETEAKRGGHAGVGAP